MSVSFAKDIKPLFREIDVTSMEPFGVLLDDYGYMSDSAGNHANAQAVFDSLSEQQMPPGGPYWSKEQLDLFQKWMSDGYQP